ncbi:MAG TPA: hypothetical protein PKW15_02500, partial [Alphaproteobacteria bacterium]|nr:hypothetical protein [Alphaproteobacteria bacterium]
YTVYAVAQHPIMYFSILWNGQPVGPWASGTVEEPSRKVEVPVPVQPGINTLSFMFVNPIQPADLPTDFDVRLRGFVLHHIAFSDE